EEGTYYVGVTVNDVDGASATLNGTAQGGTAGPRISVADAPLTATAGANISAPEGAGTGPVAVATFMDANPGDHTGDFTVTIHWGDGNTSAGLTTFDAGTGLHTVTGNHSYAEEGAYAVTVDITDVGGASASVGLSA